MHHYATPSVAADHRHPSPTSVNDIGPPGIASAAFSMSSDASGGPPSVASTDRDNSRRPSTTPSCHLCRRRKVKCDRGNPCSPCQRAGAQCVYSAPSRLPRGRQGGRRKKDSELLQRIAKLENLVKDLETGDDSKKSPSLDLQQTDSGSTPRVSASSFAAPPSQASRDRAASQALTSKQDAGAPFWITLSDEINGLRYLLSNESLDDDDDEEDLDDQYETPSSDSLSQVPSDESAWVLCGSEGLTVTAGALQYPPRAQVVELCEIYLTNAHPVCNVLHGPSLKRYLRGESLTLDCSPGIKGLDALKFAVFHAATASLDDTECVHRIGAPRTQLLANFRRCVEVALVRADFMNTVDLSTLQALVIFISSIRCYDASRFSWTLISIAVRIAQALGLHNNSCYAAIPLFQAEMRRRLWWLLCVLDSGLALDRGSDLVTPKGSFNTRRPLHINDDDIWLGGPEEVAEREEFTDMTFSSFCHETCMIFREINFGLPDPQGSAPTGSERTWERRKELVRSTHRRMEQRYLRHCDVSKSLHWITKNVGNVIMAADWLSIYRPVVREPMVSPPDDRPNVLVLSVELLEKYAIFQDNPASKRIQWFEANFVQWHPLAVTLAELCVQTEGPLVERAWKIVDRHFESVGREIADSTRGMRWRPVRKLMTRAKKARQAAIQEHQNMAIQAAPISSYNFNQFGPSPASSAMAMDTYQTPAFSPSVRGTPGLPAADALPQDAFNWDPWMLTNTDPSLPYNAVTAWRNWETFIDDFQGESYMQESDFGQPQGFGGS